MRIRSLMVMALIGAATAAVSCGGSTSPVTSEPPVGVVATPAPTPTPPPVDQPSPAPTPPPCNGCEPPVTNTNPPVRLTIRVYKVQDVNGTVLAGIPPSIPLGYTVT